MQAGQEHAGASIVKLVRAVDPSYGDEIMAKGEQKGNKEARKPKKEGPPKKNASNPSTKGTAGSSAKRD
jgi:hypothetical protein